MVLWMCAGLSAEAQEVTGPPAEIQDLLDTATGAHAALERAPADARPALRDFALSADLELAAALDGFLASPEFAGLPPDEQIRWIDARFAGETRAARLLVELGRCTEARERTQTLLDSTYESGAERPALTDALREALSCVPGTLQIQAFPENAQVWIDGVEVGDATQTFELTVGTHQLSVRAAGLLPHDGSVTISGPGEVVALGPIRLREQAPPTDRSALPRWHEWTLWGVGAVAVGVGVGYLLGARDIRDQIALAFAENPNDEFEAQQEDEASSKDLVGYIVGGSGVALIGVGTYLYVSRQADTNPAAGSISLAPKWYEWGLWILGGAGLTYAATLFTQAAHRDGYADDLAVELGDETSGVEGLQAGADDLRVRGALFAAGGIVLGTLGTALYVIRTSEEQNTVPQAGVSWTPDGAGVWLRLSF